MFDRPERHSTRWIAWMPLLFVSAFLYWSVALGLGGLSLMAAGSASETCHQAHRWQMSATAIEPMPESLSGEPIIVHLQESPEADDVQDVDVDDSTDGPAVMDVSGDDGTGRLPGRGN